MARFLLCDDKCSCFITHHAPRMGQRILNCPWTMSNNCPLLFFRYIPNIDILHMPLIIKDHGTIMAIEQI